MTTKPARRGTRGMYPKSRDVQRSTGVKRRTLPEYLSKDEVDALMRAAKHTKAAILMALQWRAGLRISEAVEIRPTDLDLTDDQPTLRVRRGKGNRDRIVPLHPELQGVLHAILSFGDLKADQPIIPVSRQTGWRWIKDAQALAEDLGTLRPGKVVKTHTLRHSAARHWLVSRVPINVVQRWLGHSSMQTTLIYLEIVPDQLGLMAEVP